MLKAYSVGYKDGGWSVVERGGDVVLHTACPHVAQSAADVANMWFAVAASLGMEGRVPMSVLSRGAS